MNWKKNQIQKEKKMPKFKDAPPEMNKLMESAYKQALDKYKDKAKAGKIAIAAAKRTGWHKNDKGEWVKSKKEMSDKEMSMVQAKDFPVFTVGTWNGETFTEADLDRWTKAFDKNDPPHFILGHTSDYKGHTRIPSMGVIKDGFKSIGGKLYACGVEFIDKAAQWIKDGLLPRISVEMPKDNSKITRVGLIGSEHPAVKLLKDLDAELFELACEYSDKDETKTIEFAEKTEIEISAIDEIEGLGTDNTVKTLTECCGRFIEDIEELLTQGYDADRCMQELWELQADLADALNLHNKFIEKLEMIEEEGENEYSENWFKEFVSNIKAKFTKNKEIQVDEKLKKEFEDKIATLEAQVAEQSAKVKEFTDKEQAVKEAQAKADQEAKDKAIAEEVKAFCDNAIKENKMTPAIREKDEPILLDLAKNNPELSKSFREKYAAPIVPLGEVDSASKEDNDKRPQVIKNAEKYARAHKDDKEFKGLTLEQATSRAVYLHSQNKIKFEDK